MEKNILGYRVWLSEILLQQTQVERVKTCYLKILESYPTIYELSKISYEEFYTYYQGMWYYSRARNILKTAGIIHHEYGDTFPSETNKLIKLPGVWLYTSEAIRAFAYGIPTLAWDTNLEKVFARFYNGRKDKKITNWEKDIITEDMKAFISDNFISWKEIQIVRDINNALMDFAALFDLKNAEKIDWQNYPIQSGVFYEWRWQVEPKEIKMITTFPIPDAEIHVTLHKDHKIYYSEWGTNKYNFFILPPALHRDTRRHIQEYFRNTYALELSVRPINKKWFSEDGKPFVAVNAQIQTGDIKFKRYDKKWNRIID